MSSVENIRERLLGPVDTERYDAFDETASVPVAQRIPLLKEGLTHWDRELREKCADALAMLCGSKCVRDILAADLSVVFKMALMKYCESAPAINFIGERYRLSPDWAKVGSVVLAGYEKERSILLIWRWEGVTSERLRLKLDSISEEVIARYLDGLSKKNRNRVLSWGGTRLYLKSRGLVEICEHYEVQFREEQRVAKEREKAQKIIAAEAEQKRQAQLKIKAETHALRSAEYEGLLNKLSVDTLFLGRFITGWKNLDSWYQKGMLKKKSGGFRRIAAPGDDLKSLQRKILDRILSDVPLHSSCHGFRRGRSVRSNAQPHINADMLVNIDLKDFFPSIKSNRVYGVFKQLGYGDFQSSFLARLTTHNGCLPQGAPTSPALANLAASRLDSRLQGLAEKVGASYTRYADDLTFSGPKTILSALPLIRRVISEEGFQIAEHKFHIARPSSRQEVTGLTVNESLSVPRPVRKRLRALLHHVDNGKKAVWKGKKVDATVMQGIAAYVMPFHPELGAQCLTAAKKIVKTKKSHN